MHKFYSFLVMALFSFALFIPSNAAAIMINDDYTGSDDHGYGDVIGNANYFGVDWLDVSITGNHLSVVAKTGYPGVDNIDAGTVYGDFFVSTNGWSPYGTAPYLDDDHETGEKWEYAFDVQTGGLYDISNAQSKILLSEDLMSSRYVFRNGQEVAIETTGLTALTKTDEGFYDGSYYSFDIDFADLGWDLSNLGFHWATATCGNDVIEGSAAPVPEPATLLLLGTGLIGIAGFSRKKFKKK